MCQYVVCHTPCWVSYLHHCQCVICEALLLQIAYGITIKALVKENHPCSTLIHKMPPTPSLQKIVVQYNNTIDLNRLRARDRKRP